LPVITLAQPATLIAQLLLLRTMPLDQLLLYFTVTFFVSASPGPVMLACMNYGGQHGMRKAFYGMAGATCGNLLLMILSAFGLGLLLQGSDFWFSALQWFGAAYLAWLGIKMWRQPIPSAISADSQAPGVSRRLLFLQAMGIAVSNPKGLIYFGAVFPQFISPKQPLLFQFFFLTVIFVMTDLLWMLAYAKGGNFIVGWLRDAEHQRWFNRISGGALMTTGALMVLINN
jgi:homoserine/homoserine lactone efflux protein